MSDSTFALPYTTPVELRLTWFRPAARMIGDGVMWLGGGVLFAATVYVMVALPGLID